MTANQFFSPLLGQSLLYPGQNEIYRGQCVQPVMMWIKANGVEPPVYPNAYQYYTRGVPGYDKVSGEIQEGDIIVFSSNLPGSDGSGHICVASGDAVPQDFMSYDSNWGPGKKLRQIRHMGSEDSDILGYLRREGYDMATFNEGDRQNFNVSFFGEDQGKFRSEIGMEFKVAMYSIVQGQEFNNETRVNAGDANNLNSALGTTNAQTTVGAVWKLAVYDYILKNLPSGSGKFKPYSGPQLFVEDK